MTAPNPSSQGPGHKCFTSWLLSLGGAPHHGLVVPVIGAQWAADLFPLRWLIDWRWSPRGLEISGPTNTAIRINSGIQGSWQAFLLERELFKKIIRKFKQKRLHYNPKCPKSSSTLSPENHTLSRSSGKKRNIQDSVRFAGLRSCHTSVVPLWGLVFLVSSLEDQIWWWVR